jgi:hypothetical protein
MNHSEIDTGSLRASLDGENAERTAQLNEHVAVCGDCQAEAETLKSRAASVRTGMEYLPHSAPIEAGAAWSRLRMRMSESNAQHRIWRSPLRTWSLAAAGLVAVAAILITTVAPIRGWAEELLSIFRVEHVAVLDINASSIKGLENDTVFNQAMSRFISEEVTVTQAPQKPQPVADAASAAKIAGFNVHLLAGQTPASMMVRSTITAQMKLDRDRIQSIVDEAGRSDLQIPASVDGAIIGLRIPAGIMASYGNCGSNEPDSSAAPEDATCVKLNELPSPSASAPKDVDPAAIAQVALQFAGLSATEAANFTQTVDWTSTFVLPVLHGQATSEKVNVGGNDAVLLRPRLSGSRFNLLWVDNGILYSLMGTGDDTTALNLASQIE